MHDASFSLLRFLCPALSASDAFDSLILHIHSHMYLPSCLYAYVPRERYGSVKTFDTSHCVCAAWTRLGTYVFGWTGPRMFVESLHLLTHYPLFESHSPIYLHLLLVCGYFDSDNLVLICLSRKEHSTFSTLWDCLSAFLIFFSFNCVTLIYKWCVV